VVRKKRIPGTGSHTAEEEELLCQGLDPIRDESTNIQRRSSTIKDRLLARGNAGVSIRTKRKKEKMFPWGGGGDEVGSDSFGKRAPRPCLLWEQALRGGCAAPTVEMLE